MSIQNLRHVVAHQTSYLAAGTVSVLALCMSCQVGSGQKEIDNLLSNTAPWSGLGGYVEDAPARQIGRATCRDSLQIAELPVSLKKRF